MRKKHLTLFTHLPESNEPQIIPFVKNFQEATALFKKQLGEENGAIHIEKGFRLLEMSRQIYQSEPDQRSLVEDVLVWSAIVLEHPNPRTMRELYWRCERFGKTPLHNESPGQFITTCGVLFLGLALGIGLRAFISKPKLIPVFLIFGSFGILFTIGGSILWRKAHQQNSRVPVQRLFADQIGDFLLALPANAPLREIKSRAPESDIEQGISDIEIGTHFSPTAP